MKRQEYISDEQVVKRAKAAVRLAIEKKKALGVPIVAYDSKTNKIYQINDDGSRTVLGEGSGKGRYSERCKSKQEFFKRRKNQYCFQECNEWHREDIELLTSVTDMHKADLNY